MNQYEIREFIDEKGEITKKEIVDIQQQAAVLRQALEESKNIDKKNGEAESKRSKLIENLYKSFDNNDYDHDIDVKFFMKLYKIISLHYFWYRKKEVW
jgi:hypothetical protein